MSLLAAVGGGKLAKSYPGSVADLLDRWLDDITCQLPLLHDHRQYCH
jgi:acyl carrier protein phosphodiesterase